jgi:hypothetical protein
MKRINVFTENKVVAIIDYSKLVTVREGKIITGQEVLKMVKDVLPEYDMSQINFSTKTITLYKCFDGIVVVE